MKSLFSFLALVTIALATLTGTSLAGAPSLQRVSIEATVPVTTEPAPNIRVRPGEFTVRRGGDTSQALTVLLVYGGTARPEADYKRLPSNVAFAPGEERVTLPVLAVDDHEVEEDETVVATIIDPTLGPLPLYEIDPNRNSATVVIHDSDRIFVEPVVSIKATRRIAEETAAPLRRLNLVGEFTVSRSGSTLNSLPAWIHVSGTATPGEDYEPIPRLVSIPAGERSIRFPVTALFDQVPEGIETVIATVSNCPPFGSLAPCYAFLVDPANASDTVFIREDGVSTASLHLTNPANRDHFAVREPILLEGVAIDLESYINRVEFWAGDSRIGTSEIFFIRAPDPGTPIHHRFEWRNAPPGNHVLTMRARTTAGTAPLVSSPVRITVGDGDPNQSPAVEIVSPSNGEVFQAGNPITIVVEGRDPDGFIPMVELFADGLKIGELNLSFFVEPPPNELQTFTFTWDHPLPGPHVLTARVTDNEGSSSDSAPVEIQVVRENPSPVVTVVARDAFAVEPRPGGDLNTATFRIQRHGSTRGDLQVRYSLAGRARNGVDYEELPGAAIIPEGERGVNVTVVPLADNQAEGRESVVLQLEDAPAYHLDSPRRARARAVISDRPWPGPPGQPHCDRLSDGLIHLCFPAHTGVCFRIESSPNLRDWSTLYCVFAIDGTVHFVGERIPGFPHRYFRIAPEPNGLPGG